MPLNFFNQSVDPIIESKIALIIREQYKYYHIIVAAMGIFIQMLTIYFSLFYTISDWYEPMFMVLNLGRFITVVGLIFLIVSCFLNFNSKVHNVIVLVCCYSLFFQYLILDIITFEGQPFYNENMILVWAFIFIIMINLFLGGDIKLNLFPSFFIVLYVLFLDIYKVIITNTGFINIEHSMLTGVYLLFFWGGTVLFQIHLFRSLRYVYIATTLNVSPKVSQDMNGRLLSAKERETLIQAFDGVVDNSK